MTTPSATCATTSSADVATPSRAVADTSVAVPAVLGLHPAHTECVRALLTWRPALAGHAWFESYSVLTRLPSGERVGPRTALRVLSAAFPSVAWLDPETSAALARDLAERQIGAGATYDALVAAAARQADLRLLTRDVRARVTYERLGVDVIVVDG